jgi:hypothetical protein
LLLAIIAVCRTGMTFLVIKINSMFHVAARHI